MPLLDWQELPLRDFLTKPDIQNPERYLEYRLKKAPPFFFEPTLRDKYHHLFSMWDNSSKNPINIANEIEKGDFRFFGKHILKAGSLPNWHQNPFSGEEAPHDIHWSTISDFGYGDIKCIWEVNRFGFVYTLVRAYWRTEDDRFPKIFWRLVENWYDNNPPQMGPNWKCGQEISFRIMALCFGLYGFIENRASTPERVAMLAQIIAVSAERIQGNLSYALSQNNNHSISEAAGLWTIGALFPEFKFSEKYEKIARKILENLGRELIYEDGSFVQHSVIYHRLMLQNYLWVLRLGELNGRPFSPDLKERIRRAYLFLYQIHDMKSGRVPYYGQNDGSLILPINNCDYLDFRPVIQSIHFLFTGTRCIDSGPWDEDLLWLFGASAIETPVEPPALKELKADHGGYYTLRSKSSFVFTRCGSFKHRPGQADQLHVDLWWRGQNIAIDPGTFSYNAPDPWNNPFAHTAYHNTVSVDDEDQMDRFGKFLWFPWLTGKVIPNVSSESGYVKYWEGRHDGYMRLKSPVMHRRGILKIGNGSWLILDDMKSSGQHKYRLHWLFDDFGYEWESENGQLKLKTKKGPYFVQTGSLHGRPRRSLVRADPDSPRGWHAPYYFWKTPAISIDLSADGKSILYWSLFGANKSKLSRNNGNLLINSEEFEIKVFLHTDSSKQIVSKVVPGGISGERLEVD